MLKLEELAFFKAISKMQVSAALGDGCADTQQGRWPSKDKPRNFGRLQAPFYGL
jgi:hypothetical protein